MMRAFSILVIAAAWLLIGGGRTAMAWPTTVLHKTILIVSDSGATAETARGILDGLAQRGWKDGEVMTVRQLSLSYEGDQISPQIRASLQAEVDNQPDLIITLTTNMAKAVQQALAGRPIPLVMAPVVSPMQCGLISSLMHLNQNVTGISYHEQEARRLQWLTRLMPQVKTIWIPYNHAACSPNGVMDVLRPTAEKLGLTILTTDVRDRSELLASLDSIPAAAQAIFLIPDHFVLDHGPELVEAALRKNRPVSSPFTEHTAQGALFSYAFRRYDLGMQASRIAASILSGTPASHIPIEQSEPVLTINAATAIKLKLPLAPHLLRQATVLGRSDG